MQVPRPIVLLFVKYPEPGHVKTRLAARVGSVRAAAIYRQLVAAVCAQLPPGTDLAVMFDPMDQREELIEWLEPLCPATRYVPQSLGDLGMRLDAAFAAAFLHGYTKVAAIGSDCIDLAPAIFEEAWRALDTHDCAIGPTEDGGYYLLALSRPCPELFTKIAWSTDTVFEQTLTRAYRRTVHTLPQLHDIDTEADWQRVAARLES